jgi:chromosomal replication initiator protein
MTYEEAIADAFGSSVDKMKSKSRNREDVEARQVAMWWYITNEHFHYSQVGRMFNRDHATASHAMKQVENLKQTDHNFHNKFEWAIAYCERLKKQKQHEIT